MHTLVFLTLLASCLLTTVWSGRHNSKFKLKIKAKGMHGGGEHLISSIFGGNKGYNGGYGGGYGQQIVPYPVPYPVPVPVKSFGGRRGHGRRGRRLRHGYRGRNYGYGGYGRGYRMEEGGYSRDDEGYSRHENRSGDGASVLKDLIETLLPNHECACAKVDKPPKKRDFSERERNDREEYERHS